MIDKFGINADIPIEDSDDFFGSQKIFQDIHQALKNQCKIIVIPAKEKEGKTSFKNVLPDFLTENYIGVTLNLDFLELNPIFPMVEQVFSAVFRTLEGGSYLDNNQTYYDSWRRQVNAGDLRVLPNEELLQSGSRIAFKHNNPSSEINIDSEMLNNDWKLLQNLIRKKNNNFNNFVVILDNPIRLTTIGLPTQKAFLRLFNGNCSPSLVVTVNESPQESLEENSLFKFLSDAFPTNKRILRLSPLDRQDINLMIQKLELDAEITIDKIRTVSDEVRDISGGQPYLASVLLEILHKDYLNTGNFTLNSNNCTKFIQSRRLKFSKSENERFQTLTLLKKEQSEIFKIVANVVLSTSSKFPDSRVNRRHFDRNKNLRELLLSQHAPNYIDNLELEAQQDSTLSQLRQAWNIGLFEVVNIDGQTLNSTSNPDPEIVTKEVRIISNTNPIILAYLRIASKEIDNDYSPPSFLNYFQITSSSFGEELAKLIGQTIKSSSIMYLDSQAKNSASLIDPNIQNFSDILTQTVENCDYVTFSNFFTRPFRNSILNGTALETLKRGNQIVLLKLTFENLALPEIQELCYILKFKNSRELDMLEKTIQTWQLNQDQNMRLVYNISVSEHKIVNLPISFYKSFLFLVKRPFRFQKYWSLFLEENFFDLQEILKIDFPHELELMMDMESDSEFNRDLEQRLQEISYMGAACGLFKFAKLGFDRSLIGNFGERFMILDDKLITNASLEDLDSSIDLSNLVIEMFDPKKIAGEYWKLIYAPWKSHKEIPGANSIHILDPSPFIYNLQHAIILLLKQEKLELQPEQFDFLIEFAIKFSENMQTELAAYKNEIHRVVAYYYKLVGQFDKARNILEYLINDPTNFSAAQVEAAHMDLEELASSVTTQSGIKNNKHK